MNQSQPVSIFISSADSDQAWVAELGKHLQLLVRSGRITLWNHSQIPAGVSWREELSRAIDRCQIALLLLSPDYLSSSFATNEELPGLVAAQQRRGARLVPILLRPCLYKYHSDLAPLVSLPRHGRPIASCKDRDAELSALSQEISKLCDQVSVPTSEPEAPSGVPPRGSPTRASLRKLLYQVLVSDSDFSAFCLDRFPHVYRLLSSGMDRIAKTTVLLERATTGEILRQLRADHPSLVAEHEHLLHYEE